MQRLLVCWIKLRDFASALGKGRLLYHFLAFQVPGAVPISLNPSCLELYFSLA